MKAYSKLEKGDDKLLDRILEWCDYLEPKLLIGTQEYLYLFYLRNAELNIVKFLANLMECYMIQARYLHRLLFCCE